MCWEQSQHALHVLLRLQSSEKRRLLLFLPVLSFRMRSVLSVCRAVGGWIFLPLATEQPKLLKNQNYIRLMSSRHLLQCFLQIHFVRIILYKMYFIYCFFSALCDDMELPSK